MLLRSLTAGSLSFGARSALLVVAIVAGAGCASRAALTDSAAASADAPGAVAARPVPERPVDLVAPPNEAIVAIHRSKCGSCHTRVEPGTLPRATIESALQRHRRRAKLTDREWLEMVDYLSATSGAN